MAKQRTRSARRTKKNIPSGLVYIQATFNNTIVTVTDAAGNTISWSSAGVKGFKGSRKSTPFAAGLVAEDACKKAMDHGLKAVGVYVKGARGLVVRAHCALWPTAASESRTSVT